MGRVLCLSILDKFCLEELPGSDPNSPACQHRWNWVCFVYGWGVLVQHYLILTSTMSWWSHCNCHELWPCSQLLPIHLSTTLDLDLHYDHDEGTATTVKFVPSESVEKQTRSKFKLQSQGPPLLMEDSTGNHVTLILFPLPWYSKLPIQIQQPLPSYHGNTMSCAWLTTVSLWL